MLNVIKLCNYIKNAAIKCYTYLKIFEKNWEGSEKLLILSQKLNALPSLLVLMVIFRRYIKILIFIENWYFKSRILY